jgi:hypothetical protein
LKALGLFLFASVLAIFGTQMAFATNTPCSGHKGGISRCQGSTFICNDGSVSASKKNCAAYMSGSSDQPLGLIDGGSGEMSPAGAGECSCRSGLFCIGPRGGHYCTTDSGRKSYLRN